MTPVNAHFYNNCVWKKGYTAPSTIEKPASLMTKVLKRKASVELSQPIKKAKIVGEMPPLIEALSFGDYEKFRDLVAKGADIYAADSYGRTIVDWVKRLRPEEGKQLMPLVSTPKLIFRHKEWTYRKYLAHAWNFSGASKLKTGSEERDILLIGGNIEQWMHIIHKNLSQFCGLFHFEEAKLFEEALEFGKNIDYHSSQEILERIQKGLPTFINTGFEGHAVMVLIFGTQFVLCNCDAFMLRFYHFDTSLLNEQLVDQIRMRRESLELCQSFFFDQLPEKLKFFQDRFDRKLELAGARLGRQKVGNCSWISLIGGCFAFLLLSADREHLFKSVEKQVEIFRNWLGFQQITSLGKMISLINSSMYEPDDDLIQRAFLNACSKCLGPILIRKLNQLKDVYLETFPLEERFELWLHLTFFRNPSCMHLLSPKYDVH